jgi:probable HAF family extracellular repeat protein
MTKLPTLGGANGFANMVNGRGQIVGLAETAINDGCPVSRFLPVVWENGAVRALQTFPGDKSGVAAAINDKGQVVGSSGDCSTFNPNSGLFLVENHALLWDSDGSVHDLQNLGGSGGIAGNHACALNNLGQVVGHSPTQGNATFYGFLWTKEHGMQPIYPLSGDAASLALGINDASQVVGASLDSSFNPRAFVWQNGAAADLNGLVSSNPGGLYLLLAQSINAGGEIVGLAVAGDGLHAFAAVPNSRSVLSRGAQLPVRPNLSDDVRQVLRRNMRIRVP